MHPVLDPEDGIEPGVFLESTPLSAENLLQHRRRKLLDALVVDLAGDIHVVLH